MGLAVTFLAAFLAAGLALAAPRAIPYLFLVLIVCFEEYGAGFTSFSGSFVFNQAFVSFFNFKFIEIVAAAAYVPLLITGRRARPFLRYERKLGILFALLIVLLSVVEYFLHSTVIVADWRLIVTGAILLHVLAMTIDSDVEMVRLLKVFVLLLTARALIGLAAYALGYGVQSPRGSVPFFWDSRQVNAFAFGAILLVAYLANYRSLRPAHRILPVPFSALSVGILMVTVLLSFRRTVWVIAVLGIMLILLFARRVRLPQYFSLGSVAAVALGLFLLLPGSHGQPSRLERYIESLNVFEHSFTKEYDNAVHIDNVRQYARIIGDHPDILALGYHVVSGEGHRRLMQKYSDDYRLGVAHNGVLRTLYFFGLGGLAIYCALYFGQFAQFNRLRRLPEDSLLKHAALAAVVVLFLEFAAAMTFVPPFYTSVKGLYYTFLAAFLTRVAVYLGASGKAPAAKIVATATPAS